MYPALENVLEPHRLQNSLACLNHVVMPLIRDGADGDQSKRALSFRGHVIPLMQALLPALDPNDIAKAMQAFQVPN